MNDFEIKDISDNGINESIKNPEKDNAIIWTVTCMLMVWIYVIIMSLF